MALISFIVEDGSGIVGATSYNAISDIDSYFSVMRNENWPAPPETGDDENLLQKQAAAIQAAFYLDGTYGPYVGGKRTNEKQGLIWPRTGAYFQEGLAIGPTVIPQVWLMAHCEVAALAISGTPLTSNRNTGPLIKRKKIDVLETEYFENDYNAAPIFGWVDNMLISLIGERPSDDSIQIWGLDRA